MTSNILQPCTPTLKIALEIITIRTNDFIREVVEENKALCLDRIVGDEVERQEPLRRGNWQEC